MRPGPGAVEDRQDGAGRGVIDRHVGMVEGRNLMPGRGPEAHEGGGHRALSCAFDVPQVIEQFFAQPQEGAGSRVDVEAEVGQSGRGEETRAGREQFILQNQGGPTKRDRGR